MTELQIANKIKLRKPFNVPGLRERKMVYACAKYFDVDCITRTGVNGSFDVLFLNGGPK